MEQVEVDFETCSICLEGISSTTVSGICTLPCSHQFHQGCLLEWFYRGTPGNCCAQCRADTSTITRFNVLFDTELVPNFDFLPQYLFEEQRFDDASKRHALTVEWHEQASKRYQAAKKGYEHSKLMYEEDERRFDDAKKLYSESRAIYKAEVERLKNKNWDEEDDGERVEEEKLKFMEMYAKLKQERKLLANKLNILMGKLQEMTVNLKQFDEESDSMMEESVKMKKEEKQFYLARRRFEMFIDFFDCVS